MKQIPLTQGYFALVDDEDFERLSKIRWHVKTTSSTAYAISGFGAGKLKMHQMIIDCPEEFTPDHINGNGLDNQRHNLRPATQAQQMANRGKHAGASSKYKGVSWDGTRGRWQCMITAKGKRTKRRFRVEEDAARAYDVLALEAFGEFARLNFPASNKQG